MMTENFMDKLNLTSYVAVWGGGWGAMDSVDPILLCERHCVAQSRTKPILKQYLMRQQHDISHTCRVLMVTIG